MSGHELTELASDDLAAIWNFIAEDSPDAADREIDKLRSVFALLSALPGMGRRGELKPGLRSFAVAPYVVYYRVTDDALQIVRVLHGARKVKKSMFQ